LRTRADNPCVVLPTGSGKSLVLAAICRDAVLRWGGRVLVLAHVKELLQQNADKLQRIAPEISFGVYSAGLKSRDTKEAVIIAGIQSVYEKACELGKFNLIIVDESHLIPESGEGRYQTFIKDTKIVNPNVRVIGLTATPYRMGTGMICSPKNILNQTCYEKPIKELIREGYLCKIHTKAPPKEIDCSGLHIRNGEFVATEVSELFNTSEAIRSVCLDIVSKAKDRKSILVFASNVAQANLLQNELARRTNMEVALITGETPGSDRAEIIARFCGEKIGLLQEIKPLKYLVNVNVLTTGFDAPNVDCIAIVRPTASPGLYVQMVGRGFRICEGKQDCLVLDYGSNIQRHGPIDAIRIKTSGGGSGTPPVRKCPECGEVMSIGVSRCSDCGYVFPIEDKPTKLEAASSQSGILSGQKTETEYEVQDIYYNTHYKKDANPDAPRTFRVTYEIGFNQFVTAWKCPEHFGWPWDKFAAWWKLRTDIKPPTNTDEAEYLGQNGFLARPKRIKVIETAGQRFPEIEEYDFTEKPAPPAAPYLLTPATGNETRGVIQCGECRFWNHGWCYRLQNEGHKASSNGPTGDGCDFFSTEIIDNDDVPF
ncbi:MAG: DEAD/DEAH box helicase, partial [Planctomycetaceae bacterium]|nr:DEAD/DEAH box helicase [Planctomycetaceae bacterium]